MPRVDLRADVARGLIARLARLGKKLWRELTPATTGVRAVGIEGSFTLAQCCTPLTMKL